LHCKCTLTGYAEGENHHVEGQLYVVNVFHTL